MIEKADAHIKLLDEQIRSVNCSGLSFVDAEHVTNMMQAALEAIKELRDSLVNSHPNIKQRETQRHEFKERVF